MFPNFDSKERYEERRKDINSKMCGFSISLGQRYGESIWHPISLVQRYGETLWVYSKRVRVLYIFGLKVWRTLMAPHIFGAKVWRNAVGLLQTYTTRCTLAPKRFWILIFAFSVLDFGVLDFGVLGL